MNTKKYILYAASFLMLLFTGCEDQQLSEIGNPELLVRIPAMAPAVSYPNKPISFPVEVEASAGIDKVLTKIGFQTLEGSEDSSLGTTQDTYQFNYTPTDSEIGQTLEFIIVAYDKSGFTSTSTYSVDIVLEPVNINIGLPSSLPDTLEVGDILEFDIQVSSEDEIARIETLLRESVLEDLTMDSFEDGFSANYHFTYVIQKEDGGLLSTFTFKVTDVEGKVKEVDYTVFIEGERLPLPLLLHSGIVMGFQSNTELGQFMDLEGNTVYTVPGGSANSSLVDMGVFRSGSSSGVNIFSPNFSNAANYIYTAANWGEDNLGSWPVRHDTEFRRVAEGLMSVEDYEGFVDDERIVEVFEESGPSTNNINKIEAGQLILFKTVDGAYGVIHIKEFVNASNGTLTFDYKISAL